MRILTVRQPWAWAIVHGQKDVENRSRNIAGDYRGPVAIHAAKKVAELTDPQADFLIDKIPFGEGTDHHYPLGAIIGVVDLVDVHYADKCVKTAFTPPDYIEPEWCSLWAMDNHHHLVLANPRPFAEPIPAKGRLGLWKPDAELLAEIENGGA